ncbi:MAG: hypothetical protein IPL27_01275 [Lewinellaceae bacterium]|nr:hypothetical protein [Lewinellaceae bacterium]
MGGDDGKALIYQTAFTYVYQDKGGKLEQVAGQHTHIQTAIKEEEAAIIKWCSRHKSIFGGRRSRFENTWAFTNTRGMAVSSDGNKAYGSSGDDMQKWVESVKPTESTFTHSNYNIKINGNMARATFDQQVTKADKSGYATHEMRCMENKWRLADCGGSLAGYLRRLPGLLQFSPLARKLSLANTLSQAQSARTL